MRTLLWWTAFTALGIFAQGLAPGVDFLAPGLVLSLQEERLSRWIWLFTAFLLIQEGSGSLAFGSGLLWYGSLSALYFFGHYLFDARSFVFMILLGASLGAMHVMLGHVMASLQEWVISPERLVSEAIMQTLVFPMEWGIIYIIYHNLPQNDARNV